MNYIDHINHLNNYNPKQHTPLIIEGKRVGSIRNDNVAYILSQSIFFEKDEMIFLDESYTHIDTRTEVLNAFAHQAFKDKMTNRYMNEPYPVIETPSSEPLALVDRSVSTLLGLISFGQHLNGYLYKEGKMMMWIARRSYTRGYEAGKLDHIVAGGLPYGIDLMENILKECDEEANISPDLAKNLKEVGYVSYKHEYAQGGKNDILYCYDLELPEDFVPVCNDGEVEEFYLMPIEEVMEIVKSSYDFKNNCNLVLIDFFIRHGFIGTDNKDYLELGKGLKR